MSTSAPSVCLCCTFWPWVAIPACMLLTSRLACCLWFVSQIFTRTKASPEQRMNLVPFYAMVGDVSDPDWKPPTSKSEMQPLARKSQASGGPASLYSWKGGSTKGGGGTAGRSGGTASLMSQSLWAGASELGDPLSTRESAASGRLWSGYGTSPGGGGGGGGGGGLAMSSSVPMPNSARGWSGGDSALGARLSSAIPGARPRMPTSAAVGQSSGLGGAGGGGTGPAGTLPPRPGNRRASDMMYSHQGPLLSSRGLVPVPTGVAMTRGRRASMDSPDGVAAYRAAAAPAGPPGVTQRTPTPPKGPAPFSAVQAQYAATPSAAAQRSTTPTQQQQYTPTPPMSPRPSPPPGKPTRVSAEGSSSRPSQTGSAVAGRGDGDVAAVAALF